MTRFVIEHIMYTQSPSRINNSVFNTVDDISISSCIHSHTQTQTQKSKCQSFHLHRRLLCERRNVRAIWLFCIRLYENSDENIKYVFYHFDSDRFISSIHDDNLYVYLCWEFKCWIFFSSSKNVSSGKHCQWFCCVCMQI